VPGAELDLRFARRANRKVQLTLVLLAPVYSPMQFPQQRAWETLPT
jgi:hypothetical protein